MAIKLFWYLRVCLKRFLSRHTTVIEFCHTCGVRQPLVWGAHPTLWRKVSGKTDGSGVLCPRCFTDMAAKKGMFIVWKPTVEGTGAPVSKIEKMSNPIKGFKLSLCPMMNQH